MQAFITYSGTQLEFQKQKKKKYKHRRNEKISGERR